MLVHRLMYHLYQPIGMRWVVGWRAAPTLKQSRQESYRVALGTAEPTLEALAFLSVALALAPVAVGVPVMIAADASKLEEPRWLGGA